VPTSQHSAPFVS